MPKLVSDKQREKALKEVTSNLAKITSIETVLTAIDSGESVSVIYRDKEIVKGSKGKGRSGTEVELASKVTPRLRTVLVLQENILRKETKALAKSYNIAFDDSELVLLGETPVENAENDDEGPSEAIPELFGTLVAPGSTEPSNPVTSPSEPSETAQPLTAYDGDDLGLFDEIDGDGDGEIY